MRLKEYRDALNIPFTKAAEDLQISGSQLSRYETKGQIPSPEIMNRIREWSKGCVQPNDFYELKS
ncbi:MAG: helix-turn-helix transcriptional regulator [Marinospirillum sp.]|uniref:helix-turn-helix domain-containing protein n=1 Tax=Marinospirillum sp. TaxID=2183934 RepID=UPI001A0B829B|nr:helix-turn-helix transcriptional regulator [Marinospirillum sp.]MBE0505875.1 helix-turn-helix transcriptional regulator [Marinospirillum sp.]